MKNRIIGLFCFMAVHLAASAQTHVQLNLNVKHKLGDVTEFNRPKFINFHATINENYWDSANKIADLRDDLIRKYDVYVGRETGMIKTVLRNARISEDGMPDGNSLLILPERIWISLLFIYTIFHVKMVNRCTEKAVTWRPPWI